MTEPTLVDTPPAAPQSLALDARAVAMLKAMGVHWRWPAPIAAAVPEPTSVIEAAATPVPLTAPVAEPLARPTESAPAATAPATPEVAPAPVPATPPVAPPMAVATAQPIVEPMAPPMALAGLDWDTLQTRVQQCQACALHNGRSHTSWGQGSPRARWLFITSGLHATDLGGDTVQGGEWQLLQSMWRAMGLGNEDAFVTSLTKCRPAIGMAADGQATAQCLPYLEQQHQWLQPQMVVALGLPVAHALLGANAAPLSQRRGQVHQWRQTPLVVTYPLDTLLRRPMDQGKAWADLCLALDHVAQPLDSGTHQP